MRGSGKLVAENLGVDATNETILLETLKKMPVEKLTSNHVCQFNTLQWQPCQLLLFANLDCSYFITIYYYGLNF